MGGEMRILLLLALVGCSGNTADKGDTTGDDTSDSGDSGDSGDTSDSGDSADSSDSGDTVDTAVCDDANEDCAVGTCGGEGSNMLPGANCLACHTSGGDREAPIWYAGGTLFADLDGTEGTSGATIHITDSEGTTVDLTTSRVGNFYTSRHLVPPLSASVETSSGTVEMARTVETGACNTCHTCDGEAGGKMYSP